MRRRSSATRVGTACRRLVPWAVGLSAVLVAPAASAMTGTNLIANGDAEAGNAAGWTAVSGGLAPQPYGSTGYPTAILLPSGTFAGGAALFHATGSVNTTVNTQTIVLGPADRQAIDSGTVQARLSAFIGGYATQNDRIGVDAEWRDGAGTPLATQSLAPVTNVERGNVSGFLFRQQPQAAPVGTRSIVVTLTGERAIGPAHDGYLDNLELRLIGIPQVEKAFSAPRASARSAFRMTYTVRNSEDLEAKPSWSFVDALPPGLSVAPTARAATDCPGSALTIEGARVTVRGDVLAGQAACTTSFDVVADRAGTVTTGPAELTAVQSLRVADPEGTATVDVTPASDDGGGGPGGVVPPVPLTPIAVPPFVAPVPVAVPVAVKPPHLRPALRTTLTGATGRAATGTRTRLGIRVANPTTALAARARVCLVLPAGLRFVAATDASSRGTTSRRCWAVGTLGAKHSWSTEVTLGVTSRRSASLRARVVASSPTAVADAVKRRTVRVSGSRDDDKD